MRILLLDIETSPLTVYVWRLNQDYIQPSNIIDTAQVLCWSAKWLGEKEIMFDSIMNNDPVTMMQGIHSLLEQADAVVHYNGSRFDIPILNREFLLFGIKPPSTYKQIDLLKVARNQFKFPSNKMDFIAKALGIEGKTEHAGFQMWVDCMAYKEDAWKEMEKYNKNDIIVLENLYKKLLPWIKQHANHSVIDNALVCPNCGGLRHQKRGFHYTAAAKYQRYQCTDCGNWFRGGKSLAAGPAGKFVNV